jgi:hypothetical protein
MDRVKKVTDVLSMWISPVINAIYVHHDYGN